MGRLFFKWMSVPAILLVLTALFYIKKPDWQAAHDVPSDFAHIVEDKKLRNTLRTGTITSPQISSSGSPDQSFLQIEMFIKEDQLKALFDRANRDKFKNEKNDFIIRFNKGRSLVANYKTRGRGSLKFAYHRKGQPRLNYTISLFNPVELQPGIRLDKFYLMSLIYDRHKVAMESSYRLLSNLNLFHCHTQFTALHINGDFQGIYLLVERPEDAIRRTYDNVTAIYRRRMLSYETKYQGPQQIEKWHLQKLEHLIQNVKGKALIKGLNDIINLNAYLTYTAFNSAIKNPDSVDELYYFVVKSVNYPEGRIEIMAWDFDEILKKRPAHRNKVFPDPLMFACEDKLDCLIQNEPLLYQSYKEILSRMLRGTLTPNKFKKNLKSVRKEVDRIESQLAFGDYRSRQTSRRNYVRSLNRKFQTRHKDLLAILALDPAR